MTVRVTLVCTGDVKGRRSHAPKGWEADTTIRARCSSCDAPAILRGHYWMIPIEPPARSVASDV